MQKKKTVRMRDIARECGVSVATVSRVLNKKTGVGPRVHEQVRAALERLEYDPLRNIPALRRMKTKTLRVITPFCERDRYVTDYFFIKALNGLRGAAQSLGYEIILSSEDELAALVNPTDSSGLLQVAGVIMISPRSGYEREIGLLLERDMPVALINRTTEHDAVICIHEDRRGGIARAVSHLRRLGYEDIRFFGPRGQYMRTYETAAEVFAEAGLPVNEERLVPCEPGGGQRAAERLIRRYHAEGVLPRAMIFYEDEPALRAMKTLAVLGYRVPDDMAVIGYDNIELCTMFYPELTSIDCPIGRMAAMGTELLVERIEKGARDGAFVQMENELIIRDSCGGRGKKFEAI